MTISKPAKSYLIAGILGAFMPLAFAPFQYWFIALLSLLGLIALWQQTDNAKEHFLIGFLYGLGYFGFGVYWVYFSLHDFGNAAPVVASLITLLLIMWLALFIGVLGWVYHAFKRTLSEAKALLLLPLLWFAMEWLKGILATGLPWLSIGYAYTESPLSAWAPWLGSYGLSALSVLISATLFVFIKKALKPHRGLIITTLLVLILTPIMQQIEQTKALDSSLKITQIQGNIAQHIKWQPDKRQQIFDTYWSPTQQHWDSDLIVWPETAVPGKSELIEESVLIPMSMIASEKGSNILFGVLVSDLAKGQYFNSMLMVGDNQGVYHKRHLVPFGEYMPFRALFSFLDQFVQIPMSDMQVGNNDQPLMSVNGVKLGVSICYEDVFSRDINRDLPDAHILINTSNDAWFGDSLAPHQHLQIAQMRALETGRPMVRSTNTGISAFINHQGKVIQKTEQFKVDAISAEVTGRTGTTFFVSSQPYQWLVFVMLLMIGLASRYKAQK